MADKHWRRASARVDVNWPALLLAGRNRTPCSIVNVSRGGAKIQAPSPASDASHVILVCRKFGSLEGLVVWRNADYAGVRFTDPESLENLRVHLDAAVKSAAIVTVKF